MDELKGYGQRMGEVNTEIHKKMLALSSLLQIGDIISSGSAQLDSLLELALEKAATIVETGFGVLYLPKSDDGDLIANISYGLGKERLNDLAIKRNGYGAIDKILDDRSLITIDSGTKLSKDLTAFKSEYGVVNAVIMPLHSGKKMLGLLIVGNRLENFKYKDDDVELIRVFAKQMAIAIENASTTLACLFLVRATICVLLMPNAIYNLRLLCGCQSALFGQTQQ